ncbi:hypothetical protein PAL_GLEAN10013840 [Pteropus alecto]|uniref:Uncharacterized protein n=1 Tax=Pteropus alecto TaxID=9402 RepID=L5K9Z5_PTEAL|nr:hypothetical protein PAL_GLEAN10013840 [Pteropus alecto]
MKRSVTARDPSGLEDLWLLLPDKTACTCVRQKLKAETEGRAASASGRLLGPPGARFLSQHFSFAFPVTLPLLWTRTAGSCAEESGPPLFFRGSASHNDNSKPTVIDRKSTKA